MGSISCYRLMSSPQPRCCRQFWITLLHDCSKCSLKQKFYEFIIRLQDHAIDKIAQSFAFFSIASFCQRRASSGRLQQRVTRKFFNQQKGVCPLVGADRMKGLFAISIFFFGTLLKLNHVCLGMQNYVIYQHDVMHINGRSS